MKRTLLFFFLLSAVIAEAQTKTHNGLYQIDSFYASLQTTTDTTNYKPVGVYNNKFKRLTYWPGSGGGSTPTLSQVLTAGSDASGYVTTTWKARFGDIMFQPYALNNEFFISNVYFNGSAWKYMNTGYGSGFQFLNGQTIFFNFASGAAAASATTIVPMKVDYNGNVALGGTAINSTVGNFTGAGLVANANGAFVQGGYLNFSSTSGSTGYGLRNNAGTMEYKNSGGSWTAIPSSSGVSDGDKGDITVSSSGATWTIDNLAVTNAKINDVAIGKVTGRTTYTSGRILIGDGSADATTSANLTYSSNTLTNNGITKLNGGVYMKVSTLVGIDLNAYLDDTYHYINVDASLSTSQGEANVYLPNLDSKNGLRYVIKKWDSGSVPVVIYPYSGQTIEGASSKTLATQYKTITIYTDGDNSIKKWYIEYQN